MAGILAVHSMAKILAVHSMARIQSFKCECGNYICGQFFSWNNAANANIIYIQVTRVKHRGKYVEEKLAKPWRIGSFVIGDSFKCVTLKYAGFKTISLQIMMCFTCTEKCNDKSVHSYISKKYKIIHLYMSDLGIFLNLFQKHILKCNLN